MTILTILARKIATNLGDNYDDAFANKSEWYYRRGISQNGFREISAPLKSDFDDAAFACVEAIHKLYPDPVIKAAMQAAMNEGYGE